MFKKFLLVLVAIIGIVAILNGQMDAYSMKRDDIANLQSGFIKTGAKYEYSNINAWAKTDDKFTTMDVMSSYALRIAKLLDIKESDAKVSKSDQTNFRQYDIEYDKGNKRLSIVVQSVKNGSSGETYILIDEYLLKNNTNVIDEQVKIVGAYDKLKLTPKVATCYVGTYIGQLNKNKISSIVKEVMENLDAEKIEGMEDENIYSISAHTNKIKEYIELGSEKINLNIALRYSKYDNKTYIWVATPIIAMEY